MVQLSKVPRELDSAEQVLGNRLGSEVDTCCGELTLHLRKLEEFSCTESVFGVHLEHLRDDLV